MAVDNLITKKMAITGEEIKTKTFSIYKKGYDPEEVRNFLEKLSEEFSNNQNKLIELENDLNDAKTKLKGYYKIEKDLRDALLSLNEPTRNSIIKAKEQIALMLKEAKLKSEEIILSAENEAKSTRDTLLFLKEQQEILFKRLKIIVESQEGLLIDFIEGNNAEKLKKSMVESAASNEKPEIKIEKILEKLI